MSSKGTVDQGSAKDGTATRDGDKKGQVAVTDEDTKQHAASSDNDNEKIQKTDEKSKVIGTEEKKKPKAMSMDNDNTKEMASKTVVKSKADVAVEEKEKHKATSDNDNPAETIRKKDGPTGVKKNSQTRSSKGDNEKTAKKDRKRKKASLAVRKQKRTQAMSAEGVKTKDSNTSPEGTEEAGKKGSDGSGSGGGSKEEQQQLLTALETAYETRLSYEQVLQRYGTWRSVRHNFVCYILIMYSATLSKSFSDLLIMITKMGTIVRDAGIGCCCNRDRVPELATAQKWNDEASNSNMNVDSDLMFQTSSILLSLASPLFEQYLGRRKSMLGALTIGTIVSVIVASTSNMVVHKICFSIKIIADMLVLLVCMTTVIEIVPYNLRFFGPLNLHVAEAIGLCLNSVFFLRFTPSQYGIFLGATFFGGLILAYFYTNDSICHLISSRRLEQAEQIISELEMEQAAASSSELSDQFHERAAKKIFEDLAYPDRDEMQTLTFLRRLSRSWKMWEIVFLMAQAFSCGLIEFETLRMYAERFERPLNQIGDRVIAYSMAFALLFLFRKRVLAHVLTTCLQANRIKVMTVTLGLMLLTLCLRKTLIKHSNVNVCGDHLFCEERFEWFSFFTNLTMGALLYTYQLIILLHFLEIAPTSLRFACVILLYVPMKAAFRLGYLILEKNKHLGDIAYLIYVLHFSMLAILLLRNTKMKSSLTIYFIDLIPEEPSIREADGEDLNEGTPKAPDSPVINSERTVKRRSKKK